MALTKRTDDEDDAKGCAIGEPTERGLAFDCICDLCSLCSMSERVIHRMVWYTMVFNGMVRALHVAQKTLYAHNLPVQRYTRNVG